jgi:hypothetical protein
VAIAITMTTVSRYWNQRLFATEPRKPRSMISRKLLGMASVALARQQCDRRPRDPPGIADANGQIIDRLPISLPPFSSPSS